MKHNILIDNSDSDTESEELEITDSNVNDELIYSSSSSGFALASMRSSKLSRYYIQCDLETKPEDYTDDFFWLELKKRLLKMELRKN